MWLELLRDLWRNPLLAAYLAIGVGVTIFHMRREKMYDFKNPVPGIAVGFFLAGMWPLLVISWLLHSSSGSPKKLDRKSEAKPEERLPDEQHS